jgi:gliding motility-associated-like protein
VAHCIRILAFLLLVNAVFSRGAFNFVENKGQVRDQFGMPNTSVLFSTSTCGANWFLKRGGFSYQFTRYYGGQLNTTDRHRAKFRFDSLSLSRIDAQWLQANWNQPEYAPLSNYQESYFNENGNYLANATTSLLLRNLYAGIDVRWFFKGGQLKYEYVLTKDADYHAIRLQFSGAKLSIGKNGELLIASANGVIAEPAPLIFQGNHSFRGQWKINDNEVSFSIPDWQMGESGIIDPLVVAWGTYYGGASAEISANAVTDNAGNIYVTGETQSASGDVATTGAYQQTYGGTGSFHGDALLVKFNAAGIRQWATYYGGSGEEAANGCFLDPSGKVYIVGITTTTNPAVHCTNGCFQSVFGGGTYDGFIASFDSGGNRLWATFLGGEKEDYLYSGESDFNGAIYIVGSSGSYSVMGTAGMYQSLNGGGHLDGVLAKFTTGGARVWSTYMGGVLLDECFSCDVDGNGNIAICGITSSTSNNFGTSGAFQSVYNGNTDGFISKFSPSGSRVWSTYYGGNNGDNLYKVSCYINDIYVSGATASTNATLVTASVHQPTNAGGFDALLVKFNTNGTRVWATFFGSIANENYAVCSASNGYIYLSGTTSGNSGRKLSTACTFQDLYGGGSSDGFVECFDVNGLYQWGSYLGGVNSEEWTNVTTTNSGDIVLCGSTGSAASNFTTASAHQIVYGGGAYDIWLMKLVGCNAGVAGNTTPLAQLKVCSGKTTTLSCNLSCGAWMSGAGLTISGAQTVEVTVLKKDTVFYLSDISCGPSALSAVNVTVIPAPIVSLSPSPSVICGGGSRSYTFTGGLSYTIDPPGTNASFITISPTATTIYTLTGMNTQCTSSLTFTQLVSDAPIINVSALKDTVCFSTPVILTGTGADNFQWGPPGMYKPTTANTATTVPLTSNLNVLVTAYQNSNTACTATRSIQLFVHPEVKAVVVDHAKVCERKQVNVTAAGGKTYYWYPASQVVINDKATAILSPTASMVYTVLAYDAFGCADAETVAVTVVSPTVFAGRDTLVKFGDEMKLRALGEGKFKWFSEEILSCDSCATTVTTPFADRCYTVTMTDTTGCKVSDVVCVTVRDYAIYAPNVFSPNDDGLNDGFRIYSTGFLDYKLSIYDRFGHQVFYTTDDTAQWDGKDYSQGVYTWKINWRVPGGKVGESTGKVLLLR